MGSGKLTKFSFFKNNMFEIPPMHPYRLRANQGV